MIATTLDRDTVLAECMPMLTRIARRWARIYHMDAEDLLQEAIVCVLTKLEKLPSDDIRDPARYLVKCGWYAIRNTVAKQRPARDTLSLDMPLTAENTFTLADTIAEKPATPADRHQVEALREAIEGLAPYLQETLAIFYNLDCHVQRRQQSANRTKNTMEAYHSRAMQRLRNDPELRQRIA